MTKGGPHREAGRRVPKPCRPVPTACKNDSAVRADGQTGNLLLVVQHRLAGLTGLHVPRLSGLAIDGEPHGPAIVTEDDRTAAHYGVTMKESRRTLWILPEPD